MAVVRFRGVLAEVDVAAWVARDADLLRLREVISRVEVQGGPLGRARAQTFVERLLVAALDDFAGDHLGTMKTHLDAIGTLRGRLRSVYDRMRQHFAAGRRPSRLPREVVDVAELTRLFRELDEHVDAIEGRTGTKSLEQRLYEQRHPDARSRFDDALAHTAEREAVSAAELADDAVHGLEVPPDLPLERVFEDLPPWERRGHSDRGRAATERERKGLDIPTEANARARARNILRRWRQRIGLPNSWKISSKTSSKATEPIFAQHALGGRYDMNFARRGLEVGLKPPDAGWRWLDGLRFLDEEGRRFLLMEHKEPSTTEAVAAFVSAEGEAKMVASMERDAQIALDLAPYGCQGFSYASGSEAVQAMMTRAIAEIRGRSPELGRMLIAPGPR